MAVLRAQGTLAAVTYAAGDLDAAARWRRAADALRAQQSLEEYWMGSLATAVAGQLAGDAGDLDPPASACERAVGPRAARRRAPRAHLRSRGAGARAGHDRATPTRRRPRCAPRGSRCRGSPSPGMFPHMLNDVDRRLRGKADASGPVEVEELSAREMSVLRLLGSELSIADIGQRALHLAQHGQDARARHLSQARRRHARGRRGAGQGAAPALTAEVPRASAQ